MQPTPGPAPRQSEGPSRTGRTTRRLLVGLIVFLIIAAIGLAVFLVWLLLPSTEVGGNVVTTECPIDLVDAVYGFGTEPDDLLYKPLAVAFDSASNLWVSDTGHGRVLRFDDEANLLGTIGAEDGPGGLVSPYGLAYSEEAQRLYVADWNLRAVNVYSADGRYVEQFPSAEQDLSVFGDDGFSPYDVEVSGSLVVVASHDGIYFFDRSGMVVDRWGGESRGPDDGAFNFPNGLAIDQASGTVYVADTLNRRVVALSPEGNVLWTSGKPDEQGKISGFWQLPRSIELGPDGLLYVVDTFRAQNRCSGVGHIVVLDSRGELVSEFGASGRGETTFNFPEHLAISPEGVFGIADRENNRALLFELGPLPIPDPNEVTTYESSFRSNN